MPNNTVTQGIVLARINYQEADRIITVLTPDHGKLRLMAKGVRREKSKLAGGIELFSISDITFLPGRREIGTLISSRLKRHFGNIVKDIDRTMLAYDMLKKINRLTEDYVEADYFSMLAAALAGLDNPGLKAELCELWLNMRLLKITGHSPNLTPPVRDLTSHNNLQSNVRGLTLNKGGEYIFDFDSMAFKVKDGGPFAANHIKLLRLSIGTASPEELIKVRGAEDVAAPVLQLAKSMLDRSLGLWQ